MRTPPARPHTCPSPPSLPSQSVLLHHGGDKLQLRSHWFPLPYHTFAFQAAQGAHVIKAVNGTDAGVLAWAQYMFVGTNGIPGQQAFWNAPTANMSAQQVSAAYASVAASLDVGVSASAYLAGMADDNLNEDTRVAWKTGCSRSVTGTPSFFVNGIPVQADSSWTLAQWQQLLDPLYAPAAKRRSSRRAGVC